MTRLVKTLYIIVRLDPWSFTGQPYQLHCIVVYCTLNHKLIIKIDWESTIPTPRDNKLC